MDEGAILTAISSIAGHIVLALPIALAAATALGQSVAADRGWRIMRGAAQSIKREIFRYRAAVACGSESSLTAGDAREALKVTIDSALLRSANSGFLLSIDLNSTRSRPKGLDEGDDEISPLTVASYTSHRIDEQTSYFLKKGRDLRKRALAVVLLSVLLASVPGAIANSYYAPWAAMAVLVVTILTAYLERSRLTDRASRYATASAELAEIKTGLNLEQATSIGQPEVLRGVVARTEGALEREGMAWEQLVWRDVRESREESSGTSGSGSTR
jgi:SMODS and SLOG-associating 2TM effector domain 1